MGADLPGWCRCEPGTSPVIVVAPHGGRRTTAVARPGAKVNDLHTAPLAAELAAALGAGLLANGELDRNLLDLNRISQIAARAPWFLDALEALLAAVLERHERAEVLVVHGWNAVQARCDLGIGTRLTDGLPLDPAVETLTVSAAYAVTRLAALRAACARAGIATAFGERYPGRHPNNLLQLFRRGAPHPAAPPRLAGWVAAGRIEAVQLELGIPVRWPGALRERFVRAVARTFRTPPRRSPAARAASRRSPAAPPVASALQAYDPHQGIGVSARLDAGRDGSAGRVLLFLGERRVALFTGEAAADAAGARLPGFTGDAGGLRLHFAGALLVTDDGRRYVDLEDALAASRLLAVELDLRLTDGDAYGAVRGTLSLDGRAVAFDGHGFARPALEGGGGPVRWRSHLSLHAGFGAGYALRIRHATPGGSRVEQLAPPRGAAGEVGALAIGFDADAHTPRDITVRTADGLLRAEPITHMAVLRPLGPGHAARVTFGIARVALGARRGFGFYEYGRAL